MGRLFGTDGVRGVANVAPMDSETILRLGRAAAVALRRSDGRHRVLIGKDTRVSGYMLETALASGISSMGVDVLLVGPLPTPGIAFMTRSMRADAGVVISASHNSYEDNGIKFFGGDGFKLADETESEIERLMEPGHLDELRAQPDLIGKAARIDDAVGRYTVFLKSCIERECQLDGLKIVLDSAHGAGYKVAPLVLSELGATLFNLGDKPDGRNINDGCGSLHPEKMCRMVRENGAHCGIALDGDADRVVLCDELGEVMDGDLIMAILAFDFKERKLLTGDAVVGTVMSNLGLELALRAKGIGLVRSDVGDRYVIAEMRNRGINLGGEQSGHIISLDNNTTGDGLLTALLVLSVALRTKRKLSSFRSLITRCPQILLNVPVRDRTPFAELPRVIEAVKAAEKELGNVGRVLLRYSGTEVKARIMVESPDEAQCLRVAEGIAKVVKAELPLGG